MIIIDTDPGVDDLMAILLALGSTDLDVVALTTVFGNVPVELATSNALTILEAAGRADIPVAQGASRSMSGAPGSPAFHIHGRFGLGDNPMPRPTGRPVPEDAADLIISRATESPGEITLFAIGPLTNLAEAARRNPGLPGLINEVVIMGGNAYVPGNATPAAEANIHQDPEAADIVFGLSWPVTMVGLDVTNEVVLTPTQIARIAEGDGPVRSMLARAMAGYQRFHEEETPGYRGLCPHDATALCWLLDHASFGSVNRRIRVESEGLGRGKTWPVDVAEAADGAWSDRPAVTVAVSVQAELVADFICGHLSAAPAG